MPKTGAKEFEKAFTDLRKSIGPSMVGWSNKVRNGSVRVYVSEIPPSATVVDELEIFGVTYKVEYCTVGNFRML